MHANVARALYDFSEQAEVNERFFSRIRACRKIIVTETGRIEIHLEGEMLNVEWLKTLAVSLVMSPDGKLVLYSSVVSAWKEYGIYVLITYPAQCIDNRIVRNDEPTDASNWHGFLISKNGNSELCISHT